jgi:hypothetical protein
MIAKLIPPSGDKNFSFQVIGINQEQKTKLFGAINSLKSMHPDLKPFIQGNSGNWVMIEFWTDNVDSIMEASVFLSKILNVDCGFGDFTREEVKSNE